MEASKVIQSILQDIIPFSNLIGFKYLEYACFLVLENFTYSNNLYNEIYIKTSIHFNTSIYNVEKSIRYVIKKSWNIINKNKYKIFNTYLMKCPTNKEFICEFIEYIRIYYLI